MIASTSFRVKDYQAGTFGMKVRGTLYQHDEDHRNFAVGLIAGKVPAHTVVIPSTVSLYTWFTIKYEWSDREQDIIPVPVWWTAITIRAFADVALEHESVVRSIGRDSTLVRVPIIEPLEVDWSHDNVS